MENNARQTVEVQPAPSRVAVLRSAGGVAHVFPLYDSPSIDAVRRDAAARQALEMRTEHGLQRALEIAAKDQAAATDPNDVAYRWEVLEMLGLLK